MLGCNRSQGRHGREGTKPCAHLGCLRLTLQGARCGWSSGEAQHPLSVIPVPRAVLPEGCFSVMGSADLGVVSPLAAFSLRSAKAHTQSTPKDQIVAQVWHATGCMGMPVWGQHPRHRGSRAACSPAGDSYRFGRGLFNSISIPLHQAPLAPKPHQTSQFLLLTHPEPPNTPGLALMVNPRCQN